MNSRSRRRKNKLSASQISLSCMTMGSKREFSEAKRLGYMLPRNSLNFARYVYKQKIYFINRYDLSHRVSMEYKCYLFNPLLFNLCGFIPPIIDTFAREIRSKPKSPKDLNFWQYPCATEQQAYYNHLHIEFGRHVDIDLKTVHVYLPLPWATYIDKKAFPNVYLQRVKCTVDHYRSLAKKNGFALRVHSVCQHIHWDLILRKAQWVGVNDIYLSHKDSNSKQKQEKVGTNLDLRGWPLIAVNYETPDLNVGMAYKAISDRSLLASFIGAHMKHYLDNTRRELFDAAKAYGRDDVLVDISTEWHFNKVVYEEQVLNKVLEADYIDKHHARTLRYNTIMSDSKFSLCPVGAGPNTLRFWDAIAVGSVPVIFSDDLAILKEMGFSDNILELCLVWNGKIDVAFFSHLASFSSQQVARRSEKLIDMYKRISKIVFFDIKP